MKAIIAALTIFVFMQSTNVIASPLVVRCSSKVKMGNYTIKVRIDITLPAEKDMNFLLCTLDKSDINLIDETTFVGIGEIEITEILKPAERSHRHKFIVTRMPSKVNSLVGFYVTDTYVNSIRVELWQEKKTFIYFDTVLNEVLKGECY
jgi:hypothetical protein